MFAIPVWLWFVFGMACGWFLRLLVLIGTEEVHRRLDQQDRSSWGGE